MTIHDPETYRKYTARTPTTVKRHGGRFLTRGDEVVTAEGEPFTERMVILEFPNRAAADAWLNDPDYVGTVPEGASVGRLIIQEGRSNTEDPDPRV